MSCLCLLSSCGAALDGHSRLTEEVWGVISWHSSCWSSRWVKKVKRCVPLIKACPKIPPASLLPNPVEPVESEVVER